MNPSRDGKLTLTRRRVLPPSEVARGGAKMPRSDVYREGLARELGATHYQSARGEAAAADPAESHRPERGVHGHARGERTQYHGRWQQRAGDVMTTPVVTVDLRTPYKRIASA